MRKLPPLKALESFEATARLGTIRDAADDLCVTPSAISHQIAKLEDHLGKALFHRRQRRLILTDAGRNYLQQVGQVFDRLEEATFDVTGRRAAETLSVSMPPSFMALWLMPKLAEFRARHPGIDLHFSDRLTLEGIEDQVDCGIEYRLAPARTLRSKKLLDDEIVPLASPAFVEQHGIAGLEDLRGLPLIMTEMRLTSWRALLGHMPWALECPELSVSYSYQAFYAATHGLGVALGNRLNAQHFLQTGTLAIPFKIDRRDLPGAPQYYFSATPAGLQLPKVVAFRDWLVEAIATNEEAQPG